MKKQLSQLTSLLAILCSSMFLSQSNLEMGKIPSDGNPAANANGPVTTTTVNFIKNTTGNTFKLYNAVPLSATFTVANQQYVTTGMVNNSAINFGKAANATGGSLIYPKLNALGTIPDANFTTAGATTAGTGMSVANNNAVSMLVATNPLKVTSKATNGTYHMADLVVTFNRPVNNPVIHLANLGGSTSTLGFAARFDLAASNVPLGNLSLSRLSGNNATAFQVFGKGIFNGNTALANVGNGSVRIVGNGITSLTFKVSIKGDGKTGSTFDSWSATPVDSSGDAILVSFSTLESDLQVTNNVNNTQPILGQNVVFTVVAKNGGPSVNTGITVQNKLPTRYQFVSKVVPAGTTYDVTTGLWTIGSLNDNGSATLTITAKVLSAGTTTSQATIAATGGLPDPNPTNNISSVVNGCVVEQEVPATDGDKSFTVVRPIANKGFVMDITKLDNSFKLSLGGQAISASEIEFQAGTPGGITIEFVDGTQYELGTGTAGNRAIWQMVGTFSAPLLRVVVSDDGTVTMFGSKISEGPLFPLKLKTGSFNTLNLNNNDNILISQRATGPTGMSLRIYGINNSTCVCYNDANNNIGTPEPTLHGITTLKRAGAENGGWPMNRNSAFTALESNNRGFVITRLPTTSFSQITAPQDGMMVYDTTVKCLKIYTTDDTTPANSGWKCFTVPTCP